MAWSFNYNTLTFGVLSIKIFQKDIDIFQFKHTYEEVIEW